MQGSLDSVRARQLGIIPGNICDVIVGEILDRPLHDRATLPLYLGAGRIRGAPETIHLPGQLGDVPLGEAGKSDGVSEF